MRTIASSNNQSYIDVYDVKPDSNNTTKVFGSFTASSPTRNHHHQHLDLISNNNNNNRSSNSLNNNQQTNSTSQYLNWFSDVVKSSSEVVYDLWSESVSTTTTVINSAVASSSSLIAGGGGSREEKGEKEEERDYYNSVQTGEHHSYLGSIKKHWLVKSIKNSGDHISSLIGGGVGGANGGNSQLDTTHVADGIYIHSSNRAPRRSELPFNIKDL